MAEEVNQVGYKLWRYRPRGLREYPDEIEGYLGCDQNAAVVA